MPQFVHLHVHTQYSILDGQASIQRLVDKAMADGQPGIAVTDHGDMFGIKEFYNYVQKVKGKLQGQGRRVRRPASPPCATARRPAADPAAEIAKCERQLEECRRKLAFKPIIGCEVYVARRRLHDKEGKPDQSGYHLILLAKNLKGYHNLIKIVSKAWTEGFYMRPRTDRAELEKYHEGLICCSACLAGEVPRAITANDLERAEESIRWHKKVFGDDYYLELQLHKATVERANHEAYPMQLHVNKHLRELAAKHNVQNGLHQRRALRGRRQRRGARPADLSLDGQGPRRPQAHALLEAGVAQDDGRDGRDLRPDRPRGDVDDRRHLQPDRVLLDRPCADHA